MPSTAKWVGAAAVALASAAFGAWPAPQAAAPAGDDPWQALPGILERIRPPTFPDRDFPVTRYGAKGDGRTDSTAGLRKAIAAAHAAGGGRVVVPAGDYLTGPVHLRSRVNLHLAAGAVLRFSQDPAQYLPPVLTRWEGVELMNYSPLVYAFEQEDIAITGEGTLDGQADAQHWWPWKASTGPTSQGPARAKLFKQAEDGVPVAERVYGAGHYLRPQFVQPYRCRNVLIEGVTIRNSPMWILHPVLSTNVTIRGVKVVSAGPNNDGCDPESSSDVLIEDALFDTGDDCIALKSGRNADGRRLAVPVERVVVRGCRMRAGHGGVTIGSEISGGARSVFVERCTMSSPDLERGFRIKTNAMRGGVIEDVSLRDVEVGEVGSAIDVDMLYEEGASGSFTPVVRRLRVERMTVQKAARALSIRTLPQSPLDGLLVRDSVFRRIAQGNRLDGVLNLVLQGVTFEPEPATR
jgi:polygalacturonase